MTRLRSAMVCLALGIMAVIATAQAAAKADWLTSEERAWIDQHPVLRVAVGPHAMPIEYLQGGQLKGLSAKYLEEVSQRTGLTFTYVESGNADERVERLKQGAVDLVSAARTSGDRPRLDGVSYTSPYHVSAVIVVMRGNQPVLFDIEDLNGKRIAIPSSNAYRPMLDARAPDATIVNSRSSQEALNMVADGSVDATIGTQANLAPYLQRQYEDVLQISGVVGGMTSDISMAVREDNPLLYSILQKSLASITTAQARELQTSWLNSTEYDPLSMQVFAEHYAHEIALTALAIALLAGLAWQAHRQRRRAWRSEQEKTMFLAVMSHEIRSPMNAVLAAVELLRYTRLDARQQHFADLANAGASTLLRLLDDVLDLSKLEAGQLKLLVEPVDLATLARDVVDLHRLRATEKGIGLALELPPALPPLMLDESRVAQVLHNLVSNAIKFTDSGGVEVRITLADASPVPPQRLDIRVADSGVGISQQEQARLFQPYSQTDRSYKTSGGTGLGLVICRELVTLMHGVIDLHSAPGAGTTVTVTLPAILAGETPADDKPPPIAAAHEAPSTVFPVPDHDVHILIVEDTPANQEVLAEQIRTFGCRPHLSRNGTEAVSHVAAREFDLILLDCHLPDTDGYALAARLRAIEADEERARCPIIAISASTGSEHVERCFAAGMDGVLSKPIRLSKLQDVIELWCGVTVDAAPAAAEDAQGFSAEKIRGLMADDVAALLEAIILEEADTAVRAAHRVHGAALTLGWTGMAQAGKDIEQLLRVAVPLTDPRFAGAQKTLVQCWRAVDHDAAADAIRVPS